MISTAHIFYIPVILLVGIFAGYYIGRAAADRERAQKRRDAQRRQALKARGESTPSTNQ